MLYGMDLWRPALNGASMTAALTWAAQLISGIHMDALRTGFLKKRSVNQDVILTNRGLLPADTYCRVACEYECESL